MAGRSQCDHCAAALGSGANYCSQCGTPQTLLVLDPLGVEDPPLIRGTTTAPHARLTMLAGLVLVFAMVAVLWGLSREDDPADEEPLSSETPEDGILAADPATSTTAVATTASPTTGAPTTTSEEGFVNGVQGPVLGDGVDGVLVQIGALSMRQIDLSTGAIERIALEYPVYADEDQSGIVVNGNLVSSSFSGKAITITDLSDGSQRELIDVIDGSLWWRVVGLAGVDSVWVATYPEPDQASEAIEVGLDGEVLRRIEIPQPFSIDWAEGDELILDAPDGSWRYDTSTGVAARMLHAVVASASGFVVTSSCTESLQCDALLDRGSGPEVVDWLSASDEFDGPIDLSPDLSGALIHVYRQDDDSFEFSYIDLGTGSRVDLDEAGIDPDSGVVWVEGSRWIIGQDESSPRALLAIDTETGTQVNLGLPSPISFQSFMAFIPSN